MKDQQTLSLEFPERVDDGSLWVPGTPRPKGSAKWIAKCVKGRWIAVQVPDKKVKAWEKTVSLAARQWWGPNPPLEGPVGLMLFFYFKRPLDHYRSGQFAGMLKSSAPASYIKTPDADKLARSVGDALSGELLKLDPLIYLNDKQVGPLHVYRDYCDAHNPDEGVRIYLRGEIDGEEIGFMPEVQDV